MDLRNLLTNMNLISSKNSDVDYKIQKKASLWMLCIGEITID